MNIVFAHFYTPVPPHLFLNLKRSIDLFPNHSIFLITDDFDFKSNIKGLIVYFYNTTAAWKKLERSLKHPKEFRSNFWFTSLARFLALADFGTNFPASLLHVESDVLISEDFPFGLLSENDFDYQFPVVSDDLAIASIMYLKNADAANCLSNLAQSEALIDPMTTDMKVLGRLTKLLDSRFYLLPTSPSQSKVLPHAGDEFLQKNSKSLNYFGGVFDGFDLGRYLFGDDPRNNRGFSRVRWDDLTVYLKSRELIFYQGTNRSFPYIYDEISRVKLPIYALHIHCKNSDYFIPELSDELFYSAVKNSQKKPRYKFYPSVFYESARLALARRIHENNPWK